MQKIDEEWLNKHGFDRMGGMQPVGCGTRYSMRLEPKTDIYISASPDTYGNYPLHMSLYTENGEYEINKKANDFVKMERNYFTVEELFTLLDLAGLSEWKEFFNKDE